MYVLSVLVSCKNGWPPRRRRVGWVGARVGGPERVGGSRPGAFWGTFFPGEIPEGAFLGTFFFTFFARFFRKVRFWARFSSPFLHVFSGRCVFGHVFLHLFCTFFGTWLLRLPRGSLPFSSSFF